jgi:hypothetical protein
MKKLFLPFFVFGFFILAPHAFAYTIEGNSSINALTGSLSNMSQTPQTTFLPPATYNTLNQIHYGTYPATGTLLENNYWAHGSVAWASFNGITLSAYAHGDGDYWFSLEATSTPLQVVMCYTATGGMYSVVSCGVPPLPDPSFPNQTRVIRINAPVLYATTTSPFTI